jgi:amino acid transporter
MAANESGAGFFTRSATGLVREAGGFDTFVLNIFFGNPWLAMVFIFLFVPPFLPGANLAIAAIITVVLALPFLASYALLAAAIPRSGGEYTYVSRIIHPAVGLMANFNITFFGLVFLGTAGGWFAQWGIAQFFRILAANTGNLGLQQIGDVLITPWGQFVVGGLLILFFVWTFSRGLGAYLKIQTVAFVLGSIGLVIGALVLLGSDHASFVAGFNRYAEALNGNPDTVSAVMEAADNAGYVAPTSTNFGNTLRAVDWAFLTLGFAYASTYIGGEIKRPARSQIRGMVGAGIVLTIVMIIYFVLVDRVIGESFLGALGSIGPDEVGLPDTPTFVELIASISASPLVWLSMGFLFIFWTFTTMPVNILNATRNSLAWSLDGLLPRRFSDVSEKSHAPVFGLVVIGLLGIGWLWVFIFTDLTNVILLLFANVLTYLTTCIALAILPYRRPELFEASPVNWRWGNIPVATIIGVLGALGMTAMLIIILIDPVSGFGFDAPGPLLFNIGVFLFGAVYYYAVLLIQRARGVDISLAFREIPVE